MSNSKSTQASPLAIILAFATVYIVWGSTYFFIQMAIQDFPPFMLGAIRFSAAALIMLSWCLFKGERIFSEDQIKHSVVSGLLLLFIGNGAVIWVEQYLPSALVAILLSSSPIWFLVLDKSKWKENFHNKITIFGLIIGFIGVVVLFYEHIADAFSSSGVASEIWAMIILVLAAISWSGGSLYSKYNSSGSASVNSAWQMLSASIAFLTLSVISNEPAKVSFADISQQSWLAVTYLILLGSIAGYSAYVWLLEVRPATQVSTYAYVNPVVAVLLGIFFAHESVTLLQILGLVIILSSVLMINLAKYKKTN